MTNETSTKIAPAYGNAATGRQRADKRCPATVFEPQGEPFKLIKRTGDTAYRVSFRLGCFRFEESTLCEEPDLAVMVARATYVTVRDLLADGARTASGERTLRVIRKPVRPAA